MEKQTNGLKVLFLDFDGVLNSSSTKERWRGFIGLEPKKIELVKKILTETDARVVISSTWRLNQDWKDALIEGGGKLIVDRTVGITPQLPNGWRGDEIKSWLDEQFYKSDFFVDRYAILDDDTHILPEQRLNFFKTSWGTGINDEIASKVIDFFQAKIRCNNCNELFKSEDELELVDLSDDETIKACPTCKVDEFLMDL
jgi:hypothetical protein